MTPESLVPPPPLPEAARAALPVEVQAYLGAVERYLRLVSARLAELEAQRAKDSRSSSRPPSSDPPWKHHPPEPPSGRQRGGQPGQDGTSRVLLEPERVDAVIEHWPARCPDCQAG